MEINVCIGMNSSQLPTAVTTMHTNDINEELE